MGRLLVLVSAALLVLSVAVGVSGYRMGHPFKVRGKVYCDTCGRGFETNVTTYIQGATVKIECTDREGLKVKYSVLGLSGLGGEYEMTIQGDRGDDICDAVLVSSPLTDCDEIDTRRSRASIILTRSNGLSSDVRPVNSMGFLLKQPLPICATMFLDTDQ
ncbi:protein DOWNSTREAM OF FLC-like [Impatiens glandulifera]|uniref:protein DOWNSTREAM OF FLC-like n=1 Tax=Impatiens glandulifera TaxID=253017 RepID=UPI001FB0C73A|nr:protein DOWNSTREAM OF FLC-like [Impatiens glandulifera]